MTNFLRFDPVRQWVTYRCLRWFLRAIFCWRTARRVLLTTATLATLIAVFYAVENWQGRRAWEQTKRDLEAQGVRLDLAAFIPPPIPDEQNFAMAPVWAGLQKEGFKTGSLAPDSDVNHWFHIWPYGAPFGAETPFFGDIRKGKRTDLGKWQKYYRDHHAASLRSLPAGAEPSKIYELGYDAFPIPADAGVPAEDVLMALSRFDPVLARLREAARRPLSRFPIHYEDGPQTALPHLGLLKLAGDVLRVRAIAELELGRTDDAFADTKLVLKLMNAIENEPFLVSHLVRCSIGNLVLPVIWEGTSQHGWTDAQLAGFEVELKKQDFLSDFDAARLHERTNGLNFLSEMPAIRSGRKAPFSGLRAEDTFSTFIGMTEAKWLRESEFWARTYRLAPSGLFERNKIACVAAYQSLGSPRRDASTPFVVIEDWHRRCETFLAETRQPTLDSFLGAPLARWQPDISVRFFETEAWVRMARIACGLERCRLAEGSYPAHLEDLSPRFLTTVPRDVIDGGAFKYRRTDDGRFVLYSLGWNGRDDGGETGPTNQKWPDPKVGDWVWKYPAE